MRRKLYLFLTAIILAASGCAGGPLGSLGAGPAVTTEFRHYQAASHAQFAAGMRVLDRLALAEKRLLMLEAGPKPAGFDPDSAAALLGVGDPPRTAVLRSALETLRAYNETLTAVGMGQPEMVLTAGLGLVEGIVPVVAPSIAARPGFGALIAATREVAPVLGLIRSADDHDRMRTALVAATPRVKRLLQAMRSATPAIYRVLNAAAVEPGNLETPDGIPPARRAQLEQDRRVLAGWVLLIDQTMVAVDVAAAAARTDDGTHAAALIDAAFRLRALADAINAARTN